MLLRNNNMLVCKIDNSPYMVGPHSSGQLCIYDYDYDGCTCYDLINRRFKYDLAHDSALPRVCSDDKLVKRILFTYYLCKFLGDYVMLGLFLAVIFIIGTTWTILFYCSHNNVVSVVEILLTIFCIFNTLAVLPDEHVTLRIKTEKDHS